jgi:hypothetical protein
MQYSVPAISTYHGTGLKTRTGSGTACTARCNVPTATTPPHQRYHLHALVHFFSCQLSDIPPLSITNDCRGWNSSMPGSKKHTTRAYMWDRWWRGTGTGVSTHGAHDDSGCSGSPRHRSASGSILLPRAGACEAPASAPTNNGAAPCALPRIATQATSRPPVHSRARPPAAVHAPLGCPLGGLRALCAGSSDYLHMWSYTEASPPTSLRH